jgi:CRP-like cAMP-binding protein
MAIDDDIAFLERVPTLSLLGRQALRILAIGAVTRQVDRGEVLFSAGEQADGGFVIQKGSFRLSQSEDGEEITVGPCTLLGEVALFAETRRRTTAAALEPSIVLSIPRPLFIRMLDSFPDAARRLRETLASRLDDATREIVKVRAFLDAYESK